MINRIDFSRRGFILFFSFPTLNALNAKIMGADVYGRQPDSEVGEYYQVSGRSWDVIYTTLRVCCEDLLDEQMLDAVRYNDGQGPEESELCVQMADRLENLLENDTVMMGVLSVFPIRTRTGTV